MARRVVTNLEEESFETGASFPNLQDEVRPEKPKPTRVHFIPLPDYAANRQSDPRSRDYDNAETKPYKDGYLDSFKATALPGFYFMEFRAGRTILGGEVIEIAPDVRASGPASTPPPPATAQPAAPAPNNPAAQATNAAAETVEAFQRLHQVLAPAPAQASAPAFTREEAAQLIEQAITKQFAQVQAAQPNPPQTAGPMDQVVKTVQTLKTLGLIPDGARQSGDGLSDQDRAQLTLIKETGIIKEFMSSVRDAMHAPETASEPESMTDKLLGFLSDSVAPFVMPLLAPAVSARLSGILGKVSDEQLMSAAAPLVVQHQEQPTQPQPTPEPTATAQQPDAENAPLTLDKVLLNFKADLIEANDPGDAVVDVVKLATEQPGLIPVIADMMNRPNGELIAILSQATGAQLAHLANAEKYLNGLRKGVKARLKLPSMALVAANGKGASAEAKTA